MNTHTVRALFRDALYQVLDNLGFRILGVLFLIPVGLSFLIGFREDGMWIAHIWHWTYEEFLRAFLPNVTGGDPIAISGVRETILDNMVALIIDWVADKAGFVFGIAAISFFVPQMLEKGAADVVFSKPVSRWALLLSRYFAGLIFVGILSALLVGGVYLGFWFTSDYNDIGLMWSVLTLVYGFAIFHAVSCTLGVFTRSTIGAILLTIVFMPVNCGMHAAWERIAVQDAVEAERAPKSADSQQDEESALMQGLRIGLTAYHIVAPKSRDATRIAKQLRRNLEDETPEFVDDELGLSIAAPPTGFVREQRSSLTKEGLTWFAPHPDRGGEAKWTFKKDSLDVIGSRMAHVKKLRKELGIESTRADISTRYTDRFEWREKRGEEERLRRKWIFQVGKSLFTIDYDAEATWAVLDEHEHSAQVFLAGIQVKDETERQAATQSYSQYFGWSGPWQFNAWFSIASTLAFIAAMLALGWWKLSRIDF